MADQPEPFENDSDADAALAGLDPATREAVHWLARRHDPDSTGFDAQAFQAWLGESAANRRAFSRMERLWQAGGDALAPRDTDAVADPISIEPHLAARQMSRRAFGRRALAAGIAALAVTGAGTLALAPEKADFRTVPGETAPITLPDGSRVELSTDTALRLAFDETERRVELLAGEAFFTVAKDPGRPFRVTANRTEAEALGTAFSVALQDDGARVAVTEHSVAVTVGGDRRIVAAGERIVALHGRLRPVEGTDAERELAWRDGKLVFMDQPLGEVVASLDRWRRGRTLILNSDLERRPVTVVLDTRRAADAVEILARAVPMRWVEVTPYLTLIYGLD